MILHPVEMGALTQLYGGIAPEAADYNGRVSYNCLVHERHSYTSKVLATLGTPW